MSPAGQLSTSDTVARLQAAVIDRYAIGRELGRGGMAVVHLAHDLKHDRPVAIKVLRGELGALLGPERFQREIRLAAGLQHPNILPVYDSGTAGGVLWYTMPYVEGDTLRARLRRRGRFSAEEVVPVLQDLARALAHAHRHGVIHRDVKPENVMLGEDYVLLADFGVAKPVAPAGEPGLTLGGGLVGTPTYMAPEQVAAEPALDHRADLYSLGVLAYELLAGEPPFAGLELGPLLMAHATREPVSLAARRPDVPRALTEIVARCLRKAPAERWPSGDALCHALRGVFSSSTTVVSVDAGGGALEDLAAARTAMDRGRWREAYVRLTAAGAAGTLEPEDLERLGEAAWWVAEGGACVRAREEAYRRYVERRDPDAAARVALALAEDHWHRLAPSVARSWLRRAERHLEGREETATHGWLARSHTLIALELERDPQAAMRHTERVLEIARRTGDTDLEALAIQDRGRILVTIGQVADGMELIDDAMAFATAGQLTPRTAGRTFCNMISTCERLGDYGRAAEWHEAADRWSNDEDAVFPGICRVHRAGILRQRGALGEAEQEARRAAEELGHFLKDVAGAAFYELGEIRMRAGDHQGAEAMYAEAHARGRDPQPGLALLRLAQEKVQAARSMIERALATPGLTPLERAKLLPAAVEIALADGAVDRAASAAEELETISGTYGSPSLVASAALARGAVELARGNPEEALRHLGRARRTWIEIDLPFELARTRTLLARAHAALGDPDAAAMEERAALAITTRIGRLVVTVLALCLPGTGFTQQSSTVTPPASLVAEGIPAISTSLVEEVRRYTEYRSADLADWHPRRREMLIVTRFANVPQIHRVERPEGARTQLTFADEPVTDASYEPRTGKYFLFSRDVGGDEFAQLYRYDLATAEVTRLTHGERSQNGGIRWSWAGNRIAYGSTRRTGADRDIWLMDPADPSTDRLLLQVEGGGWAVADWSPDDRRLLVIQTLSVNQSFVWLVDVATGEKTELVRRTARDTVAYRNARFSRDGKRVYLTTDLGSEFLRLSSVQLATRRITPLTEDIAHDVTNFEPSPDGRTIAFVVNAEGLSRLYLLDTGTGAYRPVRQVPVGLIGGLRWHRAGGVLGFTLSGVRSAGDVYSLDTGTGALTRWTESETGGLDTTGIRDPELIRWTSFDGREITGFYYRPPPRFTGKRPVVIDIHGGPEGQAGPGFQGRDNYLLAELGLALIYPNVRGSVGYGKSFTKLDNGKKRLDSVRDIGALLDWIARRPGLDSSRVMVMGGSYGGYMTLAVATLYPGRIRCALDVVGISNFVTFLENTESYRRDLRRVEYGDERDPEMRAFLERIAPLNQAHRITRPLFVAQGANDPRVPVTESEQMVATLRKRGTPVWYLLGKDEGHGFRKKENADYLFYATVRFIREFLTPPVSASR